MTAIVYKYFPLICAIFIHFGVNISKVRASDDCDIFSEIVSCVDSKSYKEKFEKATDCCYFSDITCDTHKNIVNIHMKDNRIKNSNKLFEEMGKLKLLNTLTMEKMNFDNHEIPSEVEKLENLIALTITSSKIRKIPESLSNLKRLETLELSENEMEGSIPKFIGNMVSLMYLNLSSNKFEGSIPKTFKSLENLTSLNLYDNKLTGSIPSDIKYIKKLTILNLGKNKFEGYIPYDLLEMENLCELYLQDNKKLDGYVPPFPSMTSCNFEKTDLCSLKGEKCLAPIRCNSTEIEDGNKHNGNPSSTSYLDRAITDESERNVEKKKNGLSNTTIIIIVILVLLCLGGSGGAASSSSSSNSNNTYNNNDYEERERRRRSEDYYYYYKDRY